MNIILNAAASPTGGALHSFAEWLSLYLRNTPFEDYNDSTDTLEVTFPDDEWTEPADGSEPHPVAFTIRDHGSFSYSEQYWITTEDTDEGRLVHLYGTEVPDAPVLTWEWAPRHTMKVQEV